VKAQAKMTMLVISHSKIQRKKGAEVSSAPLYHHLEDK